MKTPPQWFFRLLIWLGLGTALPSALIPQISSGSNPEVTRELSTLKDLQIGLMSFETEYGFYPLSEGETMKDDLEIHTANIRLVGALLGQNLVDNKRGIRFVEFPEAKRGKSGLVEREGGLWLVDLFGNPYRITMDTNRDSRVRNPDLKNSEPRIQKDAAEWLPNKVIAFSGGFDNILNSPDDTTSWRGGGRRRPPTNSLQVEMFWVGLSVLVVGVVGQFLSWYQATKNPYNL